MRMEDCEIGGNLGAVTAAFTRTEPEVDWVQATEAGILPAALFSLYRRAGFLSYGSSPRFLSDDKHYLFSYCSMALESIKGTLVDADQELDGFVTAQSAIWDVGKERRGEPWDDGADRLAKNHFRMLVISLCASLDVVAELTAVLLTDQIAGLVVGKAMFQRIEDWLKKPLPPNMSIIVTPQRIKLEELHQRLVPIVETTGPEKDWLPVMKLFRDKAAHLGTVHFREIGFHDKNLRFHRYFPRRWPVLWEEHMHSSGQEPHPTLESMMSQFMQQDNISYVRSLRAKVTDLVAAAGDVLDSAFHDFQDFPPNRAALQQLHKNAKVFQFEGFQQSARPPKSFDSSPETRERVPAPEGVK
jgi:hypothetical protein